MTNGRRAGRESRRRTGRPVAASRAVTWLWAVAALPGSGAAAQGYLRAGIGVAPDAPTAVLRVWVYRKTMEGKEFT